MKILFIIAAPLLGAGMKLYSPQYPHSGIAYLTAMLQKNGYDVKIVDMRLRYSLDYLFSFIDLYNPDTIGITMYSFHYLDAYKLINYLKDRYPQKHIIVGGPHIAIFRKDVLKVNKADFAIKGEGEYTFLELCQALINKKNDFSEIAGLIWRKNEDIIENQDRNFITDLDALPFPAYESFELEKYILPKERKLLPVVTSRGCPFGCVFCSVKLCMGKSFRARSPENVVDELEYWYKKGWRVFDISDDNFTLDRNRVLKICNLIIERNLKIEYRLLNGIRADKIDYELAKKMRESGCWVVSFGVETGNKEILKNIKKSESLEKIREAVDIANRVGWVHHVFFMIGHPGETYEKAMDSVKFALSLPSNFILFSNTIPYPGTELFNWISKNGRFIYPPEHYLNNTEYVDTEPVFETVEFTADERRRALRMGILLRRKKYLQFLMGNMLGSIAYLFARSDRLWGMSLTFFQGTMFGYKILKPIIKRKFDENLE